MDLITHFGLGVLTSEITPIRKLGKKGLIFGGLMNCLPDADVIAALWLAPADNLLAHRGFTHSILFAVLITLLFTALWSKSKPILSPTQWLTFFSLQMGLHLFIDGFNAYGIGWFIPFSSERFSWHALFVVDPFFSTPLIAMAAVLFLVTENNPSRPRLSKLALVISSVYLASALFAKFMVKKDINQFYANQHQEVMKSMLTPTPFNSLLWFSVAEVDSGYYVAYRSVTDQSDTVKHYFIPRNSGLENAQIDQHTLLQLKKFSQGYYAFSVSGDTLIFNDLRFGQIRGWENLKAPFSFHYYLNYPDQNRYVLQRGRAANANPNAILSLTRRIKGEY